MGGEGAKAVIFQMRAAQTEMGCSCSQMIVHYSYKPKLTDVFSNSAQT